MKRGDVYLARLDPTEGSEQSGSRPVVVVSRDAVERLASMTGTGTTPRACMLELLRADG